MVGPENPEVSDTPVPGRTGRGRPGVGPPRSSTPVPLDILHGKQAGARDLP